MANRLTWISISTAHDSKSVNFLSLYASICHSHPCDLADSEELHHWVETVVNICILLFKLQTIWVTSLLALNKPLYIPNTVLLTCKLWWHSGWHSGRWLSGWHSGSWHMNSISTAHTILNQWSSYLFMLAFTTAISMSYIWPADTEELHHWVETVVNKPYGKYLPVSLAACRVLLVHRCLHLDGMLNTHTIMCSSVHSRKASSHT